MTSFSHSRDSDNFIHATIVTSQKIIDLMGRNLNEHFYRYKVSIVSIVNGMNFGSDAVTLILAGRESDIKKSLSHLRKICQAKEEGYESTPIRSLPPVMKSYLNDMEDEIRFTKVFSYCSKEYLEYCMEHNIKPHPEVLEASR